MYCGWVSQLASFTKHRPTFYCYIQQYQVMTSVQKEHPYCCNINITCQPQEKDVDLEVKCQNKEADICCVSDGQ